MNTFNNSGTSRLHRTVVDASGAAGIVKSCCRAGALVLALLMLQLAPGQLAVALAATPATATAAAALDAAGIRNRLLQARPGLPILDVTPSELQGFWEVTLPGGQVLFVSADGNNFVVGELFQVTANSFVNLTEETRSAARVKQLAAIDPTQMVIFKPATGEPKAVITVFTDIDCGFCRKMHQEVPELNRRGVEVRYLAYPRAGVPSPSYDKFVSVWCADNRQLALTLAKGGTDLPPRSCENGVAEQYALGGEMGVTGTPTLVFADGRMRAGYVPVDQLAEELGVN
ncbi:MAG: DsbC family protein [Pseudomonadales bacterium]|jgi:thiol:disulfide interchange protein DsbC|nr:DsbC family protein [Pseudomonadales bacterium]MDP4910966.1 DsbC family protein [Pseudomonadales bacterium]